MTEYNKEDFEALAEELMFPQRGVATPDDIVIELQDALKDLRSEDPVEPVSLTEGMFATLAVIFGLAATATPEEVVSRIERESYYWTGVGTETDLCEEVESNGTRTSIPATYWQPSEPTQAWESVIESSFSFVLNGTEYHAATTQLGPDY